MALRDLKCFPMGSVAQAFSGLIVELGHGLLDLFRHRLMQERGVGEDGHCPENPS